MVTVCGIPSIHDPEELAGVRSRKSDPAYVICSATTSDMVYVCFTVM